jgi:hypothetical protein
VNKDEMVKGGPPNDVEAFQITLCIDCHIQNGSCVKEDKEEKCPVDEVVKSYKVAS